MRYTFLRRTAAIIGVLALLAACGGAEPRTAVQPAPSTAASPDGTAASASALPPREASLSASALASLSALPSALPSAQASNAASASSLASEQASSAASVAADGPYAGLQQSKTSEGYFVLGDPGAPVTLTFYSDFI